jgi:peptide/nickel transport system permease protein
MLTYILRRLLSGVIILLTVTGLSFVLLYARGGAAIARNFLGQTATMQQAELTARHLGLDRPLLTQYAGWLGGLVRGNLGNSYASGVPVSVLLGEAAPVTLSLVVLTLVLTMIFSLFLGVLAAARGGWFDRLMQVLSVILGALPAYWVALMLVIIFSLNLSLFPATGYVSLTTSFTGWLSSLTLPATSIALGITLVLAVWIRSCIIDVQRRDFVRTLRSRGIPDRTIMYRHVLRNAAAPIVQMLGLQAIALLSGVIIVEKVFALPGIGTLTLSSGQDGDVPVVMGCITFLVVVVVVINLIVDIVNGLLNPKLKLA